MFLKEISELINSDVKTLMGGVRVIMWGNNAISVHNFLKLINYSDISVEFSVRNNRLVVEGTNLKIAVLGQKEIVLRGKINKIYYKKEDSHG